MILWSTVQRCVIHKDIKDKWVWKGRLENTYTVKDAYNIISDGEVGAYEEVYQKL